MRAYYPLDGDVKDYSGNENNGTDNTSAGYVSGPLGGQAKDFDGTDDYVSTGTTIASGSDDNSFTASAWINADSLGSNNRVFFGEYAGDPNRAWQVYHTQTDYRILVTDGSGNNHLADWSSTDTNWHYITATADASAGTVKLYIDGQEKGSDTGWDGTYQSNSETFLMGKRGDDINHYEGILDDLRLYDRALSPNEIAYLYEVGAEKATAVTEVKTT